jgi:hypothetical protein
VFWSILSPHLIGSGVQQVPNDLLVDLKGIRYKLVHGLVEMNKIEGSVVLDISQRRGDGGVVPKFGAKLHKQLPQVITT